MSIQAQSIQPRLTRPHRAARFFKENAASLSNARVFPISVEILLHAETSKIRVHLRTAAGVELRARVKPEELDRILAKDRFAAVRFPDAGDAWHPL